MNVTSSIQEIRNYYYGAIFFLVYNLPVLFISVCCNLNYLQELQESQSPTGCCNTLKSNCKPLQLGYIISIIIVEPTFSLVSFYLFYIFLGLVAAPVATGFNLGLATTLFFYTNVCIVMVLQILKLKDVYLYFKGRCTKTESSENQPLQPKKEQCTKTESSENQPNKDTNCNCKTLAIVLKMLIVGLVWLTIVSFCVFFYMISFNVGPYTSTVSLLVFVVDFLPAMLFAICPMFLIR